MILSASSGFYQAPEGGVLLSERLVINGGGMPVMKQVWSVPGRGTITKNIFVNPETKPILVYNEGLGRDVGFGELPIWATEEMRSVPRADRTAATTQTLVEQGVAATGDRRTGGPGESILDEVRAFIVTPAGMVTAGILLIVLVRLTSKYIASAKR